MDNAVLIDYDNLLIGRIPHLDMSNFYGAAASSANERLALSCIQYVIEDILGWTSDDAVQRFDPYIINLMKLDKLISFINFPVEIPYGNPRYILSLIYPDRVKINQKKMVEEIYANVLSAEEADDSALKQFPRDYFTGGDGFNRFCVCITYLLENYKPMSSVDEIYEFFLSPEGKRFLYNFRLKVPADQFSINMLDVIHFITRDEPNSKTLYNYYKFCELYELYQRAMIGEDSKNVGENEKEKELSSAQEAEKADE